MIAAVALGCRPTTSEPASAALPPVEAESGPSSEPAGEPAADEATADGATARAAAIVAAADRTDDDRAIDDQRRPTELLAFLDLQPGMKVAELMSGFGYTAELLARAVGPDGAVYGQNNRFVLERFAEKGWSERLARPAMKNVIRVDRELDAPLPPEARDLDAVVMVLFYHDTYWMKVDREAMNRAIFAALRPGGVYLVVDHSGREGTGSTEVQTLHRIEESLVVHEIAAAGFKLAGSADFLRNPEDLRDWNAAPSAAAAKGLRGQSDRFVLKFVRP